MARNLGNVARRSPPSPPPSSARPCSASPSSTPTSPTFPARRPGIHLLVEDASFRARDCVCRHGVHSPVLAGQFGRAQISVVLGGVFHVRSSAGESLLGPGALLLGNPSAAYEFHHVVDGGDRSLLFDYDPAVLDEVATTLALRGPPQFRGVAIPASPLALEAVVLAEQALRCAELAASHGAELAASHGADLAASHGAHLAASHGADLAAVREIALSIAMLAAGAARDPAPPLSLVHVRRVARAVRYVEAHSADDCSLDRLADEARLSRCHFLRVFRAVTGQTPRQYLIATRLRAAATALRTSLAPVSRIAIDTGFRDLSHFTATFSRSFGASPRAYRARAAPRLAPPRRTRSPRSPHAP